MFAPHNGIQRYKSGVKMIRLQKEDVKVVFVIRYIKESNLGQKSEKITN